MKAGTVNLKKVFEDGRIPREKVHCRIAYNQGHGEQSEVTEKSDPFQKYKVFFYLNFTKKFLSVHPSAEAAHLNLLYQRSTLLRKIILELLGRDGESWRKSEKGWATFHTPASLETVEPVWILETKGP